MRATIFCRAIRLGIIFQILCLFSISAHAADYWESKAYFCEDTVNHQYKFPSKYSHGDQFTGDCDDGDMTLFNGILCASGDSRGCGAVKNSQDADGRFWRSPRRALTKNMGTYDDGLNGSAPFSPDADLGVLLYVTTTGDTGALQRWLDWLEGERPCSISGGGNSCLDKGLPRYCNLSSCTLRPLDRDMLYTVATHYGLNIPSGIANYYSNNSLLLATALANFIPVAGIAAKTYFNLPITEKIAFGAEAEKYGETSDPNSAGYPLHIEGVRTLVLRKIGMNDANLDNAVAKALSADPQNPFYVYLSEGATKNVADLTQRYCPSASKPPVMEARNAWTWEQARSANWTQPYTENGQVVGMLWDCIAMRNFVGSAWPADPMPGVLSAITQLLLDDDASPPACTLAASPSSINAGGSSTLTATCTPAATSYAWSESACDKAKNTCTVTPATTTPYTVTGTNADGTGAVASATVTVTPASLYALGVSNSGTGYGNVASSPAGIACYAPQPGVNYLVAPDCSENYASGTSVTLTATPASGSTFTGWSGACTGTGSCTVSMTEAKSVTATFAQSVTAPDCTLSANPSSITAGESSTLTATCKPTPTSYIWTGGTCAGSGSTCTVTPTATTTYTVQGANSGGTKPAVSVTVTVAPNSPPVCTLTANPASVSSGGNSTLTATCTPAATSYTWTGGSCAGTTGSICMVNPTAATTYTVKGSNAVGTGAAASITVSVSQQNKCDVAPVSRPAGSIVTGTAINESFSSSPGNDRIDGAGGIDTVIFGCNRANYTITQTTTGWTVQSDAEGLDILTNIERLRFADKTLALDIASEAGKNAGKSYRIYQAAFDRTPDAGGLKFWVGKMDDGMDMVEVSARFIDSDEFRAMYGTNPTDEVFVTLLYQHVLHRKPDQGGLDYWVDQLKRGLKTRPKVLADFSESTENQANVWETIKNGIELLN